jgi:hypothetical protein
LCQKRGYGRCHGGLGRDRSLPSDRRTSFVTKSFTCPAMSARRHASQEEVTHSHFVQVSTARVGQSEEQHEFTSLPSQQLADGTMSQPKRAGHGSYTFFGVKNAMRRSCEARVDDSRQKRYQQQAHEALYHYEEIGPHSSSLILPILGTRRRQWDKEKKKRTRPIRSWKAKIHIS